jgi:hypothetical protein
VSYFLSWYAKDEDGRWVRHTKMVGDDLEKAKVEYERLFNSNTNTLGWQLESNEPASTYAPRKHKSKNTNAWKPRRYGA